MPSFERMSVTFRIEPLSSTHDRKRFSCGTESLDRYFAQQASQDVRKRATACFVAVDVDDVNGAIAGYYTLAAGSIALTDLPEALARKLPRYPSVPVARLGRLAIDQAYQGRKLGAALLWDAAQRVSTSDLMAYALVVDAKDENAQSFYLHHEFVTFGSLPLQLLMPIASFANAPRP